MTPLLAAIADLRFCRVVRTVAAVVLVIGPLGCDEGTGQAGPPPNTVEVYRVEAHPFADSVTLVGQLASEESVIVRSEVAGVIAAIAFDEGQRVGAGDVLFELRSEEQRADVKQARANLMLARDIFERTRALSKSAVAAEAELNRARAGVDAAEAAVEVALVDLGRTRITAPFDGVLGARGVSPGDRIDPARELVQIDALERLQLQFTLPEAAVAVAEVGLSVGVEVSPFPEERFTGEVYFVSPTLDPGTRRLAVKAWVANAEGRLRPGLFARVHLEIARTDDALTVPESAVVYDASGAFVWRVTSDDRAERVPVDLGPRVAGAVVIQRGLVAGDRIVSAGTHKVFPGSPLAVGEVPTKPPVASAPGGAGG